MRRICVLNKWTLQYSQHLVLEDLFLEVEILGRAYSYNSYWRGAEACSWQSGNEASEIGYSLGGWTSARRFWSVKFDWRLKTMCSVNTSTLVDVLLISFTTHHNMNPKILKLLLTTHFINLFVRSWRVSWLFFRGSITRARRLWNHLYVSSILYV